MLLRGTSDTPKRSYLLTAFSRLALAALAYAPLTQAQESEPDDKKWYQIELIVFERRGNPIPSADAEVWPKNLVLSYPPKTVTLTDPNAPVDVPEENIDVPTDLNLINLALESAEQNTLASSNTARDRTSTRMKVQYKQT